MFQLVSGRHVVAHPDGHQHGISIQISIPADLCLTGLQISTNQRTTRKQFWGSILSRAFRETKGISSHAFEWFLSCLVRRLFCFSCGILQAGL